MPSLVAKYCKIRKIYACKICKFCIYFLLREEKPCYFPPISANVVGLYNILKTFTTYYKKFTIFCNQSTKLGNFTDLKMLFLAVVHRFRYFYHDEDI